MWNQILVKSALRLSKKELSPQERSQIDISRLKSYAKVHDALVVKSFVQAFVWVVNFMETRDTAQGTAGLS